MFNLEVDADHCYRVGEQGILVHNASVFLAGDDKYAQGYDAIFGQNDPCACLKVVGFSLSGKHKRVAEHIRDALAAGKPKMLTVDKNKANADVRRGQVCPAKTCPPPGGPATDNSCDEYPFASTKQGGTGASIRCVPLVPDQKSQGGVLKVFYGMLMDGEDFCVVVIP